MTTTIVFNNKFIDNINLIDLKLISINFNVGLINFNVDLIEKLSKTMFIRHCRVIRIRF